MRQASAGQIAAATLLGGPLGGGLLWAGNVEGKRLRGQVLGLGLAFTLVLIGVGIALPKLPLGGVSAGLAVGVYQLARRQFPAPVARRGHGAAVLAGLLGLGATVLLGLGLAMVFAPTSTLEVGPGATLSYEASVTQGDAEKVRALLHEAGFFAAGPSTTLLRREEEGLVVAFVVPNTAITEDVLGAYQDLVGFLGARLGEPVTVELCNELWMPHRRLVSP